MDELLVKYLLGEATLQEKQAVEEWAGQSEANKKQLEQLELIWDESRKLATASVVDEQQAWQRFQQRAAEQQSQTPVVALQRKFSFFQAAAAVVVIVLGGWFVNSLLNKSAKNSTVSVQAKQTVVVDTLPDGSIVTLNKNSSIRYSQRFTQKNLRSVKLNGEAFFNVAANKKKAFVISVNDVEVRVVGTSFNIKSTNGQTEVIVKSGIVEVTRSGKMVRLYANEKTKTLPTDTALAKSNVTDRLYEYYQSNQFVCDNTPLWRFVEVLNEAYGAHIVIGRAELRNLRLNATFNNESLDKVLEVVTQTFQLQAVKKGDQIILQ